MLFGITSSGFEQVFCVVINKFKVTLDFRIGRSDVCGIELYAAFATLIYAP
jgi:hypothetical protein